MAEEIYNICVVVKETGATIYASETEWCKITTVKPGREWLYCFEEMKDQPNPDYDYNEPVLHVEKLDGRLQLTVREYHGRFHVDLYAFDRLVLRDVGGPERRHVGASLIVELPEAPPAPPPVPPVPPVPPTPPTPPEVPPPAPPEAKPVTDRLDIIISWIASFEPLVDKLQELMGKLQEIKAEMETYPVKANTYSVVTIDLGTARSTLTEYAISGFAMTVFKCTGTIELKLGDVTTDVITIEPLTYPSMLVIDRMEFNRFFVRNTAQTGKQAVLIVWRRE
jgi:hypothetical protein